MRLINELTTTLTRWDCGTVRGIEITGGEPDACGHRFTVSAYQQTYGGGFIVQTNFCEFYEQRATLEQALGKALWLAAFIDADGEPARAF